MKVDEELTDKAVLSKRAHDGFNVALDTFEIQAVNFVVRCLTKPIFEASNVFVSFGKTPAFVLSAIQQHSFVAISIIFENSGCNMGSPQLYK